MVSRAGVLKKLRNLCLALPEATETVMFGQPTFRVDGKMFSLLQEHKRVLGICVKVEKELQELFVADARFFRTPYVGRHGWVTLKVHAAPLDWEEIRELLAGSYRLVAPRRLADRIAVDED